jgi:hypothetical protein
LLRLALIVAIGGTIPVAVPSARAQEQKKSRLLIGLVASEQDDRAAVDAAKKYFEGLKANPGQQKQEQERADKDEPPGFPNPSEMSPTSPAVSVERAMMVAALPQLSLGDALLAAGLLTKPGKQAVPDNVVKLEHFYRWARLADREIRLLALDEESKLDDSRKGIWEEVAKARDKGEPAIHPVRKWVIYSRPGKAKDQIEYFLLVRQPSQDKVMTEYDLKMVRPILDEARPTVFIQFTDQGKDRLKDFTTAHAPKKVNDKLVYSFMALVVGPNVVEILGIGEVIDGGSMKLRGRYRQSEVMEIARTLQGLKPR